MLLSKDERLERMEKRLVMLEKLMDRRFEEMEDSFKMLKDVIRKMQTDKKGVEKDRDFLIEKQKEAIRKLALSKKSLITPIKNEFEEIIEDIKKIGKEGAK